MSGIVNLTGSRSGVIGTTTGAGITYETGAWTPDFQGSSGSAGSSNTTVQGGGGKYTRTGDMVFWSCQMTWVAKGSWTGDVHITGLPFVADASSYYPGGIGYFSGGFTFDHNAGAGTFITPRVDPNQVYIVLQSHMTANASFTIPVTAIATGTYLIMSGWYRTSA